MASTVMKGRPLMGGKVTGEALVCPNSVQGWLGLASDGTIIEKGHPEEGKKIDGKILILPGSRGSTAWSTHFYQAALEGHKPLAWAFTRIDSKCGNGVVALEIPAIADFPEECDPCKLIKTGDLLEFDGDAGTIEILKKA